MTRERELDTVRRCDLYRTATQTVFGEGGAKATLMLVGEQPATPRTSVGGRSLGQPGQLLRDVLAEAGIEKRRLYVTNAVTHFKWRPQGKRRIHKPDWSEIQACDHWLRLKLTLVRRAEHRIV
jgi:uracil-DNA glycosylase